MSDLPGTAEVVSRDSTQVNVNGDKNEIKKYLDESCLSHQHRQFINNRKKLFSPSNPKN